MAALSIDRQSEGAAHDELRAIVQALKIETSDLIALPYAEQLERCTSD